MAGPRQVGKSTIVKQVTTQIDKPVRSVSADEPALKSNSWIAQQWEAARTEAIKADGGVLVLDEVQKIPDWSETVKRLWDEDTRNGSPLQVVVLGSAPLLVRLVESADGAHLVNAAINQPFNVYYWNNGNVEVGFIIGRGRWRTYRRFPPPPGRTLDYVITKHGKIVGLSVCSYCSY